MNQETMPFDDCKTPDQYSWDRTSIAKLYDQSETTSWGKYTGLGTSGYCSVSTGTACLNDHDCPGTQVCIVNASPRNYTKALSAHANAGNNKGGFNDDFSSPEADTGLDGDLTAHDSTGDTKVECFDCHSSHGSQVSGITSNYATFNGEKGGANLKETQQGRGGYELSYFASKNMKLNTVNPYNAGAGQCFDCHESAEEPKCSIGGYYSEQDCTTAGGTWTASTPWGYSDTYHATKPIMGYKDTSRFGNKGDAKPSTQRFAERNSRTIVGGHQLASHRFPTSPNFDDSGASDIPANYQMNALCSPCHDPHGVSPTLDRTASGGEDLREYAVPLLKGTWMTSPYKEDFPPPLPWGSKTTTEDYPATTGRTRSWGKYHQYNPGEKPYANFRLDRNTFGFQNDIYNRPVARRIDEDDQKFAGLCIGCHLKEDLVTGQSKDTAFRSVDRIHESVKGWGQNTEHSYPCSKCHQPHNSGLPRLMVTNCLDYEHRGRASENGVVPWAVDKQHSSGHSRGGEHRGYPIGGIYGNTANYEAYPKTWHSPSTNTCHTRAPLNDVNDWPANNLWNDVTLWSSP
jgi:hypothetical protein